MPRIHAEHYLILPSGLSLKIPAQVPLPLDRIKLICLWPASARFFPSGQATAFRLSICPQIESWVSLCLSLQHSTRVVTNEGTVAQHEAEDVGRSQPEKPSLGKVIFFPQENVYFIFLALLRDN